MPIDIEKIAKTNDIILKDYQSELANKFCEDKEKSKDGFSLFYKTNALAFYNDKIENEQRKRFTIAHELAHIFLFHSFKKFKNEFETQANMLAIRLLAPEFLIKELDIKSIEELAKTFNISLTSAKFRYERYKMLLERDKFYTSKLERKLLKQFKELLQKTEK